MIYRRTNNLRALQLLLGHTKIESTARYLGIEVDDRLAIAEQVDVRLWGAEQTRSALALSDGSGPQTDTLRTISPFVFACRRWTIKERSTPYLVGLIEVACSVRISRCHHPEIARKSLSRGALGVVPFLISSSKCLILRLAVACACSCANVGSVFGTTRQSGPSVAVVRFSIGLWNKASRAPPFTPQVQVGYLISCMATWTMYPAANVIQMNTPMSTQSVLFFIAGSPFVGQSKLRRFKSPLFLSQTDLWGSVYST